MSRRLAERLRAEWIVVFVETPAGLRLPKKERDRVWQTLRLAERLGAETAVLSGERPAEEILKYARRRNVSKIVVGKPLHPRWKDVLFGSVRDELERASGDIDVYVIAGEAGEGWPAAGRKGRQEVSWRGYLEAVLVTALAIGISTLITYVFDVREQAVAQWVYDHSRPAGKTTDTLPAAKGLYLPLKTSRIVGVLGVHPADPQRLVAPEQLHLLETFANQIALAVE